MEKTEITNTLRENVCKVTFTKVDGTERVMRCTLQEAYLPTVVKDETKQPRKKNDKVVAVWDLEKDAWRSFLINSVKDLEVEK